MLARVGIVLVPLSYSASLGLYSASPGPYGSCTYLPLFALIPVPLVQLDSTGIVPFARVLNVPTCPCYVSALVSLYSVFVMGNPSHVRVLVCELSRCNCIATPIGMDSLLVMSCEYLCWLFVLDL